MSGPGEFALKSLGKFYWQTVTRFMRVAGSGTGSAGAGSGNEGNKAMKDGGIIRDLFPGTNSPGQASVDVSVGHVRGFSTRTRFQCSTYQASAVWVGVVARALGPSDFLRKSWEIVEPVAKFWESSAGNSGIFDESFTGAPITTGERAGSLSCDSAACEG
jgi:hypothetical protein